ncbi:MAG: phospho-sugar mutase [Christensenellales bacterium]
MDYKEMYKVWKEYPDLNVVMREELENITDEKELEDKFYCNLEFGTAGLRGVQGCGTNRMNEYVIRRATQAVADYINSVEGANRRGVVIAYDSRFRSDEYALESALVLCANGIKVFLYESLRTVPQLSFSLTYLKCFFGIVITASHNPKQYNGYKVYGEYGGQLPPTPSEEIMKRIENIDMFGAKSINQEEAISKGLLTYIGKDLDEAYCNAVKSLSLRPRVFKEAKFNAVYTPLHGAGNMMVQRVLKELGFQNLYVVKEQELPDGNFPTVKLPNPEDPDAFTLGIKLAKEVGATLVLATDPDGDRLGAAVWDREQYRLLTGNQIGCLLLHYILSSKKEAGTLGKNGYAIKSIVSTKMADTIANHFQVEMASVLTGFRFIAEKIHETTQEGKKEFLFGFEESFGFLAGNFVKDKDGICASMLLCETAAYYALQGKTLLDALAGLFKEFGYFEEGVLSYTFSGIEGQQRISDAMAALRQDRFSELGGVRVEAVLDYLNGTRTDNKHTESVELPKSNVLYYELADFCWAAVRPSGTEPKLKAYIGTMDNSYEASEKIQEAVKKALKDLLDRALKL